MRHNRDKKGKFMRQSKAKDDREYCDLHIKISCEMQKKIDQCLCDPILQNRSGWVREAIYEKLKKELPNG